MFLQRLLVLGLLFIALNSHAQPIPLPMNRLWLLQTEHQMATPKARNFSSVKPYLSNQMGFDTIQANILKDSRRQVRKNIIARKVKQEHLIDMNRKGFVLMIDPVLDLKAMRDQDIDTALYYTNTRGLYVMGGIGSKVGFYTSFFETQSVFPTYLDSFARITAVAPGMGRHKAFKANGYDYGMASGLISIDAASWLNISAGNGKQFIGDGYRSLLLSDNAFNFPYARLQFKGKRWQYLVNYGILQNLDAPRNLNPGLTELLFTRKAYTFHYFLFNVKKRLQLGLFQSIIWQANDSSRANVVDPNIFNPVAGVAIAQYGLGNKNNVLAGLTARFRLTKDFTFYGQLALDDIDPYGNPEAIQTKYGTQWGIKWFRAFTIKHLMVQYETNSVRPFMYSSGTAGYMQSYTHYGQALASPVGANFKERVLIVNYRFLKDFYVQFKLNRIFQGRDSSGGNSGANVFELDKDAFRGYHFNKYKRITGNRTELTWLDFRVGYFINYRSGLSVFLNVQRRKYDDIIGHAGSNVFISAGISSNLYNLYHDF